MGERVGSDTQQRAARWNQTKDEASVHGALTLPTELQGAQNNKILKSNLNTTGN